MSMRHSHLFVHEFDYAESCELTKGIPLNRRFWRKLYRIFWPRQPLHGKCMPRSLLAVSWFVRTRIASSPNASRCIGCEASLLLPGMLADARVFRLSTDADPTSHRVRLAREVCVQSPTSSCFLSSSAPSRTPLAPIGEQRGNGDVAVSPDCRSVAVQRQMLSLFFLAQCAWRGTSGMRSCSRMGGTSGPPQSL